MTQELLDPFVRHEPYGSEGVLIPSLCALFFPCFSIVLFSCFSTVLFVPVVLFFLLFRKRYPTLSCVHAISISRGGQLDC
jgi:hypothetical protein